MPHRTVDPIAVGAQLVTALQTIVSRSLDPLEPGVVSVTALHAGDTWNVVPDSATLRGSVRAFDEAVQSLIEQRLRELVAGIAASFGAATTIRYERRYPPTINWVVETEHASQVARSAFGESAVRTAARPLMASEEDFAYMRREKPGCFALIGNALQRAAVSSIILTTTSTTICWRPALLTGSPWSRSAWRQLARRSARRFASTHAAEPMHVAGIVDGTV